MASKADAKYKKEWSDAQLDDYYKKFKSFDENGDGTVDKHELMKAMRAVGEYPSMSELNKLIAEVDVNRNGVLEFNEFLEMLMRVQNGTLATEGGSAMALFKSRFEDASKPAPGRPSRWASKPNAATEGRYKKESGGPPPPKSLSDLP